MKRSALYAGIVCCVLLFTGTAMASSPVQTQHFRIIAQGGNIQESELKNIGEQVESIYRQVSDALGVEYKSSGKIEVRVFVTPEKGSAVRAAASASTIYLTRGEIDRRVLKHELTHILIFGSRATAPRWFSEGMAQYISEGDMRKSYKGLLPLFKDFSFTRLEAGFGADKKERNSYLYAWAIVSYAMETYGKDKVKDIFRQSGSFSDKFKKALGVDLRSIEQMSGRIFAEYKYN